MKVKSKQKTLKIINNTKKIIICILSKLSWCLKPVTEKKKSGGDVVVA